MRITPTNNYHNKTAYKQVSPSVHKTQNAMVPINPISTLLQPEITTIISRENNNRLNSCITQINEGNSFTIKLSHQNTKLGTMQCNIIPTSRNEQGGIQVYELVSHARETVKGVGRALLDLAFFESFKQGFDGRLSLTAANHIGSNSPLLFYLKYGFIGATPYNELDIKRTLNAWNKYKIPIPNIEYGLKLPYLARLITKARLKILKPGR